MKFPSYINQEDIDGIYNDFSRIEEFDDFINRLICHPSSKDIFDSIYIAAKGKDFNWQFFIAHCLMGFTTKKDELKTKKEMDERSNKINQLSVELVNLIKNENEDNPMWVMAHGLKYNGEFEFYNVDPSIFEDEDRIVAETLNVMAHSNIAMSDLINVFIRHNEVTIRNNNPLVSQPKRQNADVIHFCRVIVPFFRHHLERPLFSVVASLVNALYEIDYDVQDVRDSLRGFDDKQW